MRAIAYNYLTKKWETVYPEDEVEASRIITQYWSESLGHWVTIPE